MTTLMRISPWRAYMRTLRATSEIAAAMTVWSPLENPARAASSRPVCRAWTTSLSDAIATRRASATDVFRLASAIQERQPFLEVESGRDPFEAQAELHHGEGDVGLDTDDHRFRPAQPRHVRDVSQRS